MLKDLPQGLRVKLHQETGAQMQRMEKIRRAEFQSLPQEISLNMLTY